MLLVSSHAVHGDSARSTLAARLQRVPRDSVAARLAGNAGCAAQEWGKIAGRSGPDFTIFTTPSRRAAKLFPVRSGVDKVESSHGELRPGGTVEDRRLSAGFGVRIPALATLRRLAGKAHRRVLCDKQL